MFVVGLIGCGALLGEAFRVRFLCRNQAGVIVFHFVIVRHHGPRKTLMDSAERRVHLVIRITRAILVQRARGHDGHGTHRIRHGTFFVDVIAEVDHQVEVFLCQMIERRVVTRLVLLARDKGKAEAIGMVLGERRGACPSHRTRNASDIEAVPIPGRRLEPTNFGVNAMRGIG